MSNKPGTNALPTPQSVSQSPPPPFLAPWQRLRTATQILVEELGASGPMDSEGAAVQAVAEIQRLKREREELMHMLVREGQRSHQKWMDEAGLQSLGEHVAYMKILDKLKREGE